MEDLKPCPFCGSEGAYGDQCEKCGSSLNATDLINPRSAISGSQPVMKETLHWFLPLDKHEKELRRWILEENKDWKPILADAEKRAEKITEKLEALNKKGLSKKQK